jgi:hypothetical protein
LKLSDLLFDKPCSGCGDFFAPKHPKHELCPSCFAGSDNHEIQRRYNEVGRIPALEALRAMCFEALICWTCAEKVSAGRPLSDIDRDRLTLACRRLRGAVEVSI